MPGPAGKAGGRRDLSRPDHLPNLRPDREPPKATWLPRQRRGTTPQMVGRYPDFDVFDAAGTWDAATAQVIARRMQVPDSLSFFSEAEEPTLRAFCDTCVAQDDEPRVPVAEMVDEKLAAGRLDGYQYGDMPDDRDTWRLVLVGLDEVASSRYGQAGFWACGAEAREAIVEQLSKGQLGGGSWDRLNVARAWSVCMRMVLSAFYAHPWAWNEIGFPGPAYPRGYMRLGPVGIREPFERPGATDEDPVRAVQEGEV
ncbi:MAG: gluconate 2-dehydrogenase subunit 3 family protein [Acidimicrobiales bacterium]